MALRKSTTAAQSVRLVRRAVLMVVQGARALLAKKASDQLAQPLEKDNGWVTKTRRDSALSQCRRRNAHKLTTEQGMGARGHVLGAHGGIRIAQAPDRKSTLISTAMTCHVLNKAYLERGRSLPSKSRLIFDQELAQFGCRHVRQERDPEHPSLAPS